MAIVITDADVRRQGTVHQPPRGQGKGVIYFKNNSGLAIQFADPARSCIAS